MVQLLGTEQLQLALQCVSKDLERVQSSLSDYETMMLNSERVTPQMKDVVSYYREQTTALRKEMLSLCGILTILYKNTCVKDSLELDEKANEIFAKRDRECCKSFSEAHAPAEADEQPKTTAGTSIVVEGVPAVDPEFFNKRLVEDEEQDAPGVEEDAPDGEEEVPLA